MSGGFLHSGGGGFTDQVNRIDFTGAGPHLTGLTGIVLRSDLAAGSTASDVIINTINTRADGKLLDIQNNGVTKCYVNNNGTIVNTYSGNATLFAGAVQTTRTDRLGFWAASGGALLGLGVELTEQTAPAGVANAGIVFAVDNGAGKTQLKVQFGTGAAQLLATEP